ncbi:hypothetical protein OSB04_004033 [Centaurea solstitialis]|uniref:Uncharacterized protein n=1 Tax=Centaurea solstitialis TaxID=347529 RepID=A0AA38WNS3_9ASTR|nr:hypothetical protein OSB04_004033 [Centaurea solstitialis]
MTAIEAIRTCTVAEILEKMDLGTKRPSKEGRESSDIMPFVAFAKLLLLVMVLICVGLGAR